MNLQKSNPSRVGPTTLTTSAVTQFTADAKYGIERFSFTNYSADAVPVTLHVVTSGGSPSNSNKIIGELSVDGNDQITVPFPIILEVNETISALAGSSSSINLTFNVNRVEMSMQ